MDLFDGYKTIAVRDDRFGNNVISYSPTKDDFMFSINGKPAGPFTLKELQGLRENINDVVSMRKNFLYIEEYSPDGSRPDRDDIRP